jgi:hypothetical protein
MPRSQKFKGGVGFFSRPPSSTHLLKRLSRKIRGVFGRSSSSNHGRPLQRTFRNVPLSRRDSSNSRSKQAKRSFTQRISRLFGYNKTPLKRDSPEGVELTTLKDRRIASPLKTRQPLEPPQIDWIDLNLDTIRSMTREEKIKQIKELFDYPDRYLKMIPNDYLHENFYNFSNEELVHHLTDNQLAYVLIDLMKYYLITNNIREYNWTVRPELEELNTLAPHIYVRKRSTVFPGFLVFRGNSVWPDLQSNSMEELISQLPTRISPEKINKDTIVPLDMFTFEALKPFVAKMPSVYHEKFTLHL